MNIILLIPETSENNVVRDVLYGCWCSGKRIGGGTVPPLTLLSVATVLKNENHSVEILYFSGNEKKTILKSNLIIILTSTMTFTEDIEVMNQLKKIKPDCKIAVFGSHPTFMTEHTLLSNSFVDYAVTNEPEIIIKELVDCLEKGNDISNVKGLAYKKNGNFFYTGDRPFIQDLDSLPVPDRTLIPKKNFYNPLIFKYPYTTVETSRGCTKTCYFCTAPKMYGYKIRYQSAEKVFEEIRYLAGLGFKTIYFRDEIFTALNKRNRVVFELLKKKSININWLCNAAVGSVSYGELKEMKQSGCYYIKVGVETGSQKILDSVHKQITIAETADLFDAARKLNIFTHAHLMIGLPGESKDTINETLKFLFKIKPTTIDIGIYTPYPGSKLFSQLSEKIDFSETLGLSMNNLHIHSEYNKYFTDLTNHEIEYYLKLLYKKYYFRIKYFYENKGYFLSPARFINALKAGLRVASFSFIND